MPAKKKFTRALFDRVMARIDAGQKTEPACESEGINHSTFWRHVHKDAELQTLYQTGRDARDIPKMEDEAYRRAVEGTLKPVYQQGRKVGTTREYSDGLLTFLLKARRPEVYAKPDAMAAEAAKAKSKGPKKQKRERSKKEDSDFAKRLKKHGVKVK